MSSSTYSSIPYKFSIESPLKISTCSSNCWFLRNIELRSSLGSCNSLVLLDNSISVSLLNNYSLFDISWMHSWTILFKFLSSLSSTRSTILFGLGRANPPLFSLVLSCWKLYFQSVVQNQGKNLLDFPIHLANTHGSHAPYIQKKKCFSKFPKPLLLAVKLPL